MRLMRRWEIAFGAFIMLYNALFAALIITHIVRGDDYVEADNILQALGPLSFVPLCLLPLRWLRRAGARPVAYFGPVLLGLGVLNLAAGQAIYTYIQRILQTTPPTPSWADVFWLLIYPCMLGGILLLPLARLSRPARLRMLLDAVLAIVALATFSWYFLIGPVTLASGQTLAEKFVIAAYPMGDLLLMFSALLLLTHPLGPEARRFCLLLASGIGIVVITDSIYDYQNLHNTYQTGTFVDLGWPIGYMIVALAVPLLYRALLTERVSLPDNGAPSHRTTLPLYTLVPAVGVLWLVVSHLQGSQILLDGVSAGAVVLVVTVIIRQVTTLVEVRQLYSHVRDLNRDLHDKNEALLLANARLAALATTDPLTGLLNHGSMAAAIDREIERSLRFDRPCALIFMDIDHFKGLNDGYGHQTGDAVLRAFADIVGTRLRGVDTLGRWGGEEFVALLPETDLASALTVAEHIRLTIAESLISIQNGLKITCSFGVATFPAEARDRDGLIARADAAMYVAKRLGRNQVCTASDPAALEIAETRDLPLREHAALIDTVEALVGLVEARDDYTGSQAQRVEHLTRDLALEIGLDITAARMVGLAGRLRDIGKVGIPDAVLHKRTYLTADEWKTVRQHPTTGADVLRRIPALQPIENMVRAHHERWDGAGYPTGLAGEAIPLGARIVAVVDAYDAMISDRPYRKGKSTAHVLEEIRRGAGTQFDPAIANAFVRLIERTEVATASTTDIRPTVARVAHPVS